MIIAVLADELQKKEMISKGIPTGIEFIWADSLRSLAIIEADYYMDLLFEMDQERVKRLKQLPGKAVFINAVAFTTKITGGSFIHINAWPGMLQRPIQEIALASPAQEKIVQAIFESLQWKYMLTPDVPGMISARVLAMIFNEAWYTLDAGVSTANEIDTAMKLGTNYPLGPFEWCDKIGIEKIYQLLKELSKEDSRYSPSPALEDAVNTKQLAARNL